MFQLIAYLVIGFLMGCCAVHKRDMKVKKLYDRVAVKIAAVWTLGWFILITAFAIVSLYNHIVLEVGENEEESDDE